MKGKLKIAKPAKSWYEIRALSSATAEVWIYEDISEDWFGEGLTAKRFVEELNALSVTAIDLHINSAGGSVFDGQAIYNALVRHPAAVTTYIDGLAASIASIVALAGETVVMAANALFMIHNSWGCTCGNAGEMRSFADLLEKVDGSCVAIYEQHSAMTAEEIKAAMDSETWMTAEEAQTAGFVDEIGVDLEIAAKFDLESYGYRHVPAVAAAFQRQPEEHTQPAAGAAPVDEGGSPSFVRPEAFVPGLGYVQF